METGWSFLIPERVIVMSVIRVVRKESAFVQIDKSAIYDDSISFKAKGILLYLLSRPDGWKFYETEIAKNAKDGLDSVRSGIKELIEAGYIERHRTRNEKGYLDQYDYTIYEVKPIRDEEPYIGKTYLGKSNTINKDSTNKELKDKRYIITSNDDQLFKIYSKTYTYYLNKEHPTVTKEQLDKLEQSYRNISSTYDLYNIDEWTDLIYDHFDNLSEKNNGSIFSFLDEGVIRRYLKT